MFRLLKKVGLATAALVSASVSAIADEPISSANDGEDLEEVLVQGVSSLQQRLGDSGSISVIDAQTIREVAATHPSEVLNRVPGVWVKSWLRSGTSDRDTICRVYRLRRMR